MKLHKLISRTVLATALLGATFGGVFSGTKVSADSGENNGGQLFSTLKGKQIKQIKFFDGDIKNVGDSDQTGNPSDINGNTNYTLGGASVSYIGNNQNFQKLNSNNISDAGGALSSSIPQDNENLNNTITANSNDNSSHGSNYSGTQADITSGLLTLNAVPNFNFGNNDNDDGANHDHRKLHLMNNDSTNSNAMGENTQDGNNNNLLSVTDYRQVHQQGNSNKVGGWNVSAKLSGFNPIDDTNDSQYTSSNQNSQWMINLTESTPSTNYYANNYNRYDNNNNNNDRNTQNSGPTISNNATLPSDNNSIANFMNTNNDYTNGHGTTNVNYGSNDTSLTTPYNVQPGKYAATITWTLSSTLTSVNN